MDLHWPLVFRFAESILVQQKTFDIHSLDNRSFDYFSGTREVVGDVHTAKFEKQLTNQDIEKIHQY